MTNVQNPRTLTWAIIASQFAPPFMFSGVAVTLPSMGSDLEAGATSLGLVETLFLGGGLAFLLPLGRLADATDKNTLYKLGLLGFGITSILIGVLSSVPLLLALRFLQGVSSATFSVTGAAILADIVPLDKRGRAYGASLSAIYAGLTLGPICAGFLIELWGWRSVFLIGGGALHLAHLMIHLMLPSRWRKPVAPIHISSILLSAIAVLCWVFGSALLRRGASGYGLIVAGFVVAGCFVCWQKRLHQPLLDIPALLANKKLRNALLIQLLLYLNAYTSIFLLSVYMQVSLDHPAKTAGKVLAIGTALMAISAPFVGTLSDRYKSTRISSFGVAGVLASSILATTLDMNSSLFLVTLILSIQGLGYAFFSTPNMTLIMGSVPKDQVSMASALGAKARSLGMVAGMLVTSILISIQLGNDPIERHPEAFAGIMVTSFGILACHIAVAFLLCIWKRNRE